MPRRLNPRALAARAAREAAARAEARALAVRPRAAPAPAKPLALPAPGPGLPPQASKPRGGQFWTGKVDPGSSPDDVASRQAADLGYRFLEWQPDDDYGLISLQVPDIPKEQFAVQDWLARSLAKYYKTDFGAPDDPLRDLAARGLHYDVDMTPERWKATVDSYLMEDPIGQVLFPPNPMGGMPGAGSDLRGTALAAMPWLEKQPVTDSVYGIMSGGLDLEHFADELYNALNPEASGLPADLALRPESLARMSFPQAVERVGRINQFRVKQMEEQAATALNNPAIQTFKEYPDAGFRWVELRAPDIGDELPEGFEVRPLDMYDGSKQWAAMDMRTLDAEGRPLELDVFDNPDDARRAIAGAYARDPLQEALRFEGDTMGHCVGGYCDDVLSGRSRIFSLRDAKGQPHVTIETAPTKQGLSYEQMQDFKLQAEREAQDVDFADDDEYFDYIADRREQIKADWLASRAATSPEDIIQIKGKQNRAPVDDYLPYVQDFVKGGTWGNVGDLRNTGLVKLPDGRFITTQQAEEAIGAIPEMTTMRRAYGSNEMVPTRQVYNPSSLDYMDPEEWAGISPYFEGFAIGGRVDASRCFSRNPLSVRTA